MYIKTNYIYKPLWRVLVKLFYLILLLSISSYCSGQFYNNNQFILQEKDKQYHFAAGTVITGVTYEWALRKYGNKRKALFISVGMGLAAGIMKETLDSTQKNNVFDGRDVLATSMGSLSISIPLSIFRKQTRKKKI